MTTAEHSIDYLYHGSPNGTIDILEPRQAYNGPELDGPPAVWASDDMDYAIFMALIGGNWWGGWDGYTYPGKGFYVYEEYAESLTLPVLRGYVYFLPSAEFSQESPHSFHRATTSIKPLGVFAVSVSDLPKDISIVAK
jgi:hypothetical protein